MFVSDYYKFVPVWIKTFCIWATWVASYFWISNIQHGPSYYTSNNNSSINTKKNNTRKQKWKEKQLYEYFKQQADKIAHGKTWIWLRKGNLKSETKSFLIAA